MKTASFCFDDPMAGKEYRLLAATTADRDQIYRIRHDVYALELNQHARNAEQFLTDRLDSFNQYLVAWRRSEIAGFVSITPPEGGIYSVDKYLPRSEWPFPVDDKLFEIRLLTVVKAKRGWELAPLLMHAALRWVESRGGNRVMVIGRKEIRSLYSKVGLEATGRLIHSGQVTFELMHATVESIQARAETFGGLLEKLEAKTDWSLPIPFRQPASCFHGGEFFKAVGERFDTLEKSREIINADVLDAWFPPAPGVLATLQAHLPWLLRTSPPAESRGLAETIAQVRRVPVESILPGAGSSDLIFLGFQNWLNRSSRVLILDPTYGEYPHILERVIRCRVDRIALRRENHYRLEIASLDAALRERYDLVVLVNPNSPTGRLIHRSQIEELLARHACVNRFWIDETYIDFVGTDESLEAFAVQTPNVVVCKSMSKVYALSGVRVAYLCAAPEMLETLRSLTPPWAVSLPAQVAAVCALQDPGYYAARYEETRLLREDLARALRALGWDVVPGQANFLLAHLPAIGPNAASLIDRCRQQGLFLRNASNMGNQIGPNAIRIAVKDRATNDRMVGIIRNALRQRSSN